MADAPSLVRCHAPVTLTGYAERFAAYPPSVMRRTLRIVSLVVSTLLPGLFHASASAQTGAYPTKTIRLVVPFPPGAGTDTIARIIAQELSESMKASFLVCDRVWAGSTTAWGRAAQSAPPRWPKLIPTVTRCCLSHRLSRPSPHPRRTPATIRSH